MALTRAKYGVIIVGNPKVLSKVQIIFYFFSYMIDLGWFQHAATVVEQPFGALQGAWVPGRGPAWQPQALLHAIQQAAPPQQQGLRINCDYMLSLGAVVVSRLLTLQAVYSRYINPALMESLLHQGHTAPREAHDVLSQVGAPVAAQGPLPAAMVGFSPRRAEPLSQRQPLSQGASLSQGSSLSQVL